MAARLPETAPPPAVTSFSSVSDGIGAGDSDWTYSHEAIVATHDGGRSWHVRGHLPAGYEHAYELVRVSGRVVYGVAFFGNRLGSSLLRSTDDGRTWRHVPAPRGSAYVSVSFRSLRDGVLGDDSGRFYATHDGARTWRLVGRAGEDLRTFAFLTRTHGLALAQAGLEETLDGGRTWHPYTAAPVESPLAFATLGPDRVWILDRRLCRNAPSCPGAVVRTADGGRTWQRVELNAVPWSGVDRLDFVTPSVGYSRPWRTVDGGRDWTLVGP